MIFTLIAVKFNQYDQIHTLSDSNQQKINYIKFIVSWKNLKVLIYTIHRFDSCFFIQ